MLIYAFFVAALRFSAEHIVQTYHNETTDCRRLLQKAKDADIETVRNAYCVEVVDADQLAVRNTLNAYGLGFLQSNETYSTFEEVLEHSCKVPDYVDIFLRWTAGVVPMTCAWILMAVYYKIRKASPPTPPPTPPPSPDKPPRCPPKSKKPARQRKYVRELYKAVEPLDPPRDPPRGTPRGTSLPTIQEEPQKSAFDIVNSISPSLRKRMMGDDV